MCGMLVAGVIWGDAARGFGLNSAIALLQRVDDLGQRTVIESQRKVTKPGAPAGRQGQDCQGMTAASPASTVRRAACSSLITCMTALMRARWVNAWGKLPRCRPDRGSISSAYSNSGLA